MKKGLVHFPNIYAQPDMCFWVEDGLKWYVADLTVEAMHAIKRLNDQDGKDIKWEDFFLKLADAMPFLDDWEVFDLNDSVSPQELLGTLRRAVAARGPSPGA